jgi:hypothetical protein
MVQLSHSFSGLELFDTCPKRYNALKVEKSVKPEDSEASLAGTRDHKFLEDRLLGTGKLPAHLSKAESVCDAITNSGLIIKPEQEFAITKELEPCDWWHQDAFLRVKADVGLYSETTAALLDWKTGKRRPKPFQLELGALTQFLYYPKIKSTKAAFLWLKEGTTDKYEFTREDDYERILDKLMAKVERVEEAKDEEVWQAKPGFHCNWCELKDTCTSSQARR